MKYTEYAAELTEKFIAVMDSSKAPWQASHTSKKPLFPINGNTSRAYSGSNLFNLWLTQEEKGYSSNEWLTYNQIKEKGGMVIKGEKSSPVTFWTDTKKVKQLNPETQKKEWKLVKLDRPAFAVHRVFNLDQTEGIEKEVQENIEPTVTKTWGEKESELKALTKANIIEKGTFPKYTPATDTISMPPKGTFKTEEAYLGDLTHELVHWSMAEKRLNLDKGGLKGTKAYAREELVAELGSVLTCTNMDISTDKENSLSYIASWGSKIKSHLRENPTDTIKIFNESWKASDYILSGKELTREQAPSPTQENTDEVASLINIQTTGDMDNAELKNRKFSLNIPFSEKEEAKKIAKEEKFTLKWNKANKSWEASNVGKDGLKGLEKYNSLETPTTQNIIEEPLQPSEKSFRVYLDISYSEKGQAMQTAKEENCVLKWDSDFKGWYTYNDEMTPKIEKYLPKAPPANEHETNANLGSALLKAGASEIPESLVLDGKFHRIAETSDKEGKKSISYIGYANGVPNAVIINHKQGTRTKWVGASNKVSKADIKLLKLVNKNNQEKRDSEMDLLRDTAAHNAKQSISELPPATAENAYCLKKEIAPKVFFKEDENGSLVIPIYNIKNEIRSTQTIKKDGTKTFLKHGNLEGNFVPFGKIEDGQPIVIAEGVATAATLHETLGLTVLSSLQSANIKKVAASVKENYSNSPLIFAADNDHQNQKSNIGIEKAKEAADKFKGHLIFPTFHPENDKDLSDFNDLSKKYGKKHLINSVKPTIDLFLAKTPTIKPTTKETEAIKKPKKIEMER